MIRVLHYVGKMDRGGMETFIMNLYRNIDRMEIQFDFAVHGSRNGEFENEIRTLGGRFFQFPAMRQNPYLYRKAWCKFWQEHKQEIDVFHFHTNSLANVIALEEAAKAGIKTRIVHAHSAYASKGKLQFLNNRLHLLHQKKLSVLATQLCACSEKASKWLFGSVNAAGMNVQILKNGVDLAEYKYNPQIREKCRKEWKIQNEKVIGHIGAFLPVKNQRFLIDIIDEIYKKDQLIRAVFVGDGPMRAEIQEKIKEKELEEVITLLGVRSDVSNLLQGMDCLIMPSLYEGLPVSLVEAQASGLPILMSDSITDEVMLNHNIRKTALSDGAVQWAEAVLDLISSEKRSVSQEEIIRAGFDIRQTAKEYQRILKSN